MYAWPSLPCIAIVALGADQLSKYLAQTYLTETDYIQVIPRFLHLTLVHNPGASLGMGANSTWVISLFAIVACCVLV